MPATAEGTVSESWCRVDAERSSGCAVGSSLPTVLSWISVGLVLIGWLSRVFLLGSQSFWYDEGYSVYIASLPWSELLDLSASDMIPPLHSTILRFWLPIAGRSEYAARFVSAASGLIAAAAVARLAEFVHSRQAGLVTGALAAVSPFLVWHSQDARMYMLEAALAGLGTLLLACSVRSPGRRPLWLSLAVLDALAMYAHMTASFVLVFHGVVIALAGLRDRRVWRWGGASILATVVAYVPWLSYALPRLGENAGYYSGALGWRFVVVEAFSGFVTGGVMEANSAHLAVWMWGAICLGSLAVLVSSEGMRGRAVALLSLTYFMVPALTMAAVFRTVPKFSPRHLVAAAPALFLLVGAGLAEAGCSNHIREVRHRYLVLPVLLVLLATSGVGLYDLYVGPAFRKADFRQAARIVHQERREDEEVLIVPGHVFPVWEHYFGPYGWTPLPNDRLLDVRHTLHYRNTVGTLNRLLEEASGVWLVQWEPWVIDPTGIVPALLDKACEEVPVVDGPVGMVLRYYRLEGIRERFPPQPEVESPQAQSFDLPIELAGCSLPEEVAGDSSLTARCFWRASDILPEHLSVSVRIVDTAGVDWSRADSAITGPYLVAGQWPVGHDILGSYDLQPSPGVPPGDFYRTRIVLYEPDGTEHGDAEVQSIVIHRPSAPFSLAISEDTSDPGPLGGISLMAARVGEDTVLPGDRVTVDALWSVSGPFDEPSLLVDGGSGQFTFLPEPGTMSDWREGDEFRTTSVVPISPHAAGGKTRLWAVSGESRRLLGTLTVGITRTFALPPDVSPAGFDLADLVSLVGGQVSLEERGAANAVRVTLWWRANSYIESPYTVFVHVIGPGGRVVAQGDAWPRSGDHPTTHWIPGEYVEDSYSVELPVEAEEGRYSVAVGMYEWQSGERLPVVDRDGQRVPDDAIPIGGFVYP